MDRSDVEMKKGLVQGGGPDGDSMWWSCPAVSAAQPQVPKDLQTPGKSGLAAISDIVTDVPADSTGRIRRGNLEIMLGKARNWACSE